MFFSYNLHSRVHYPLKDPLTHIFNICIDKVIWPDALKTADVIPSHKSKEKHIANNYRPISLISNIAKVLEKIIRKSIITFINKCDILAENQYGFRKNKSTKDALTLVSNVIYDKLDKSTPIAVIFLDIAKAFDTVNHQILLQKLYIYGVRGSAHDLIKSYLGNRFQKVKLNRTTIHLESVNVGVAQGTILGLLLSSLYINDLLLDIPEHMIVPYADDSSSHITLNIVATLPQCCFAIFAIFANIPSRFINTYATLRQYCWAPMISVSPLLL